MSSKKFCNLCRRMVQPRRKIGVGSFILFVLTGGLWLLILLFYEKRCPICHGNDLSRKIPTNINFMDDYRGGA